MSDPTTTLDLDQAHLEVRETDDGAWELEGRIVPYGETVDLPSGERERFAPGAFTDTDPTDVVLLVGHDRQRAIGRGVELSERDDGAYMRFRLARTPTAAEQRQLVLDGVTRGLSVGFMSRDSRQLRDRITEHTRVILREVSLALFPVYRGAAITGVREDQATQEDGTMPNTDDTTTPEAREDTSNLVTREELEAMSASVEGALDTFAERIATLADVAPAMSPRERREAITYRDLWLAQSRASLYGDDTELRALADITGTTTGDGSVNADGLMPASFWPGGLVNVYDDRTPMFDSLGRMPWPTQGDTQGIPQVVSGPGTGKRSAQKAEANTAKLRVELGAFGIQWFDSAADVALELIRQSNPAVLTVLWERMAGLIAGDIEDYVEEVALANATAEGAVLPTGTYAALVAKLITTSEAIRTATGAPGNILACQTSDWAAVLGMVDGNDRRQFARIGATNADGVGGLLANAVDIGGILAVHAHKATETYQYNTVAFKRAHMGPERLQAVNPGNIGQDVAMLDGAIVAPVIPAGIIKYTA